MAECAGAGAALGAADAAQAGNPQKRKRVPSTRAREVEEQREAEAVPSGARPKAVRSGARPKAVRSGARPKAVRSLGVSMTSEEVLQLAQAEGWTLVPAATTSGYRGVTHRSGESCNPYKASVWRVGKKVQLGSFATAEEAALCIARTLEGQARSAADPDGAAARLTAARLTAARLTAPLPLTSEEALGQAKEEGLVLHMSTRAGKAGYRGVVKRSGLGKPFRASYWHAQMGKQVQLGSFATAEEAALRIARLPEWAQRAHAQCVRRVQRALAQQAKAKAEAKRAEARAAAGGAKQLRKLVLMEIVKERQEKLGRGIGRHKKGEGLSNFAPWMKEYRKDDFVSELLAAMAAKAKQSNRIELVAVASTEGARALAASSVSSMPPGCSAIASAEVGEAVAAPSKAQLLRRLKADTLTAHAPVHPPGVSVPAAELNQIKVAPLAC